MTGGLKDLPSLKTNVTWQDIEWRHFICFCDTGVLLLPAKQGPVRDAWRPCTYMHRSKTSVVDWLVGCSQYVLHTHQAHHRHDQMRKWLEQATVHCTLYNSTIIRPTHMSVMNTYIHSLPINDSKTRRKKLAGCQCIWDVRPLCVPVHAWVFYAMLVLVRSYMTREPVSSLLTACLCCVYVLCDEMGRWWKIALVYRIRYLLGARSLFTVHTFLLFTWTYCWHTVDILLTCWHTVDVHVCCNVVSSYPGEQEWNNTRHTIHHPYTTSRAVDLFVTYSGVVTLAVTYLVCGWNGCEFSRNSGVNFIWM